MSATVYASLGRRVALVCLIVAALVAGVPGGRASAGSPGPCSVGHQLNPTCTVTRDYARMWLERGFALSGDSAATMAPLALTQILLDSVAHGALHVAEPATRRRVNRMLGSRGAPYANPLTHALRGVTSAKRSGPRFRPAPLTMTDRADEQSACQHRAPGTVEYAGVLPGYLALIRGIAPYAQVTDTFYSPRPGRLHNGYDIGLDAGTPIPAGWPGKVVKLTPWYGSEYAITVLVDGVEVQYGHLVPSVKEGDFIAVGQIVGTVAYNHVDIKMMVGDIFIDWGVVNPFPTVGEKQDRAGQSAALRLRRGPMSIKGMPGVNG